ncbi:MAG: hypothetical protein JSS81_12875 [Acidobacteria bacterium]|nr:hypothetical protein [Acidobacteriota bacterium]
MRLLLSLMTILGFAMGVAAQAAGVLLADGTRFEPARAALQPTVGRLPADEAAAVEKQALAAAVEFAASPQEPADETQFVKNFELLDVAKGFFIARGRESEAFLYTAWSARMRRNYQGIIVFERAKNGAGGRLTKIAAHYAYRFRGDRFIRRVAGFERDARDGLAVFSDFSTRKEDRRTVRIVGFTPAGLEKRFFGEIFVRIEQKQLSPVTLDGRPPAKRVYIPPLVTAAKIFAAVDAAGKTVFRRQEFRRKGDAWTVAGEPAEFAAEADPVDYVELVRPSTEGK